MQLTTEEVRHVAELAKLALTEEEIVQYTQQLSAILDYAALLRDLSLWLNSRLDPEIRDRIRQRWARDFYRALLPPAAADTQDATH